MSIDRAETVAGIPALSLRGIVKRYGTHTALAGIDIKLNIEGGTQQMQDNVRAFLSLSRYAERDDLQAETLERLEARIPVEAAKALEPLGYYEPQVTYQAQRRKPEQNDWKVTINIVPGRAARRDRASVRKSGSQ